MKMLPLEGKLIPVAICDFAKALPKLTSNPITSPVDFISGPRSTSTPLNFLNGNTASFTANFFLEYQGNKALLLIFFLSYT